MNTIPASHDGLTTTNQILTLSTIGADGYPQVSAVWFALDDDGVLGVSLNRARQKTRNLVRTPKATLHFVDPTNPYKTLEIRADAEIVDDTDYAHAAKVHEKYNSDLRTMDGPGETRVWVRFHPVKINAFGE